MTQLEYLEVLLNDCGFNSRVKRNDYLSRLFGKDVKYLDQLTSGQRSGLVNKLKEMKAQNKPDIKDDRDPEDDN